MTAFTWMVILIVLAALLLQGNVKGNKKYIIVACILLFCVYGLRDAYSIGGDTTSSYLHGFQKMGNTEWSEIDEASSSGHNQGFFYFEKLMYDICDGDYQLFIVCIAAFIMIVFAHFISNYSPSPVQSVLYYCGLLYYTFMFSALKQSIAMAFVLLAFDAVIDKKAIRFLILVFVASRFHFPSLVFLPAYWIANMKIGRSYLITLAAMLLVTFLLRDQLLDLMTDVYDTTIYENELSFLANKVIIMLIIVVAALVLRPPTQEDRLYCALLQLVGVAIVLQTFANYNNTFERLADYYFQFSVVFIPMVFESVELRKEFLSPKTCSLIKTVAPILFCAFAIWRFLNYADNNPTLSPYAFFFQGASQ